jgi:hypothetical protein
MQSRTRLTTTSPNRAERRLLPKFSIITTDDPVDVLNRTGIVGGPIR